MRVSLTDTISSESPRLARLNVLSVLPRAVRLFGGLATSKAMRMAAIVKFPFLSTRTESPNEYFRIGHL